MVRVGAYPTQMRMEARRAAFVTDRKVSEFLVIDLKLKVWR